MSGGFCLVAQYFAVQRRVTLHKKARARKKSFSVNAKRQSHSMGSGHDQTLKERLRNILLG
ncbi:hypothetical protein NI35_1881 [Salmonella enterica subsp. enterica serovar Cerro]|nr:hypothetical protein GW13_PRO1596 [Salmonella enterica subsp. enterica serovar Cerro]KMN29305.1 hypothetical protein NI35_1881 [Salmonella enterica subsp. enterica serovar Cerro]